MNNNTASNKPEQSELDVAYVQSNEGKNENTIQQVGVAEGHLLHGTVLRR